MKVGELVDALSGLDRNKTVHFAFEGREVPEEVYIYTARKSEKFPGMLSTEFSMKVWKSKRKNR